jgi:hypothetical protein
MGASSSQENPVPTDVKSDKQVTETPVISSTVTTPEAGVSPSGGVDGLKLASQPGISPTGGVDGSQLASQPGDTGPKGVDGSQPIRTPWHPFSQ